MTRKVLGTWWVDAPKTHDSLARRRALSWNNASAHPNDATIHGGRARIYVVWVELQDIKEQHHNLSSQSNKSKTNSG